MSERRLQHDPVDGTYDEWWPAHDADDVPINTVVLAVAHHNATGHAGGGGGGDYECEVCDFAIEDGVVLAGGLVRWAAAGTPEETRDA